MAFISSNLPVANPTKSYWQSPPHPKLENFSSGDFPTSADTIIIGSGITGALIAHELLKRDHGSKGKSILMLEARTASSGATGRNGGHIKPDCYRGFQDYKHLHGPEIAKQQCEFERANLESLTDFIKTEGLEEAVDLVELRACDAYMTETAWMKGLASYEGFKAAGGNTAGIQIHDAETARQTYRIKDSHGAITYPACSLWPYKLVTALLERCISKGLQLYTNTPALNISNGSGSRRWTISTPQGNISCDQIFHATNGYSSYLVPEISEHLLPLKGTVVAIEPSEAYDSKPFDHTYAFHWGEDFDYLIQRPNDGKPLIYGGQDLSHPLGLFGHVGDSDDSKMTPEVVHGLESVPSKYFKGWDNSISSRLAWTGIMALTSDELPLVGELPGKQGQFIAAGYNGHGMARAFLTVKALCQSVYGETVDPVCPSIYFDISGRLSKAAQWPDGMFETISKRENANLDL